MIAPAVPPKPAVLRLSVPAAVTLLFVLGIAAYLNSFAAPFVFDDIPSIQENRSIRQLWPIGRVLLPDQAGGVTSSGRPVVNLSFALNHAISGYRVWSYHGFNLAVHLAAALCLFGLLRRTLRVPAMAAHFAEASTPLACAIAGIWLLHPLQTESVTYIVQRAESLVGLFYLLTLYAFVRATHPRSPVAGSLSPVAWLTLSVAACALGMATKEVMVTAPVLLLLYDRTFVAGSFGEAWRARRGYYLSLAATWILLGLLVFATGSRGGTAGFSTAMSPWHYALTQCRALVTYVRLALWPYPLVFDYGLATAQQLGDVWLHALAVIGALAVTVVGLIRRTTWGFAAAACFAMLAPSSSFVPVVTQTMAEHRMYLPLAAIAALVVAGVYVRAGWRALYGCAAVALVLAATTTARNHDYRSETSLWADTAEKLPTNARAHNNLGQALFRGDRVADAMAQYNRAIALQPKYPESHYNLGVALARVGRLSEAISHYETAVQLQPVYPEAHNNLGNAFVRVGRIDDALAQYDLALRQDPAFAEAQNNLGNALLAAGRLADAVPRFERALQLKPDYPEARYNLGNALAAGDRMTEALAQYRRAVQLKPDYAEAHVNAGNALLSLDRPAEAVAEYQRALALNPQLAEAANNLGTVFLHTGRIPEAIAQFERALAARPDFADAQRNLAEARARRR